MVIGNDCLLSLQSTCSASGCTQVIVIYWSVEMQCVSTYDHNQTAEIVEQIYSLI